MNKVLKKELRKRGLAESCHTHNPKKTFAKMVFTDYGEQKVYTDSLLMGLHHE